MSSSNSPCAACKCLRRKCTLECVFAPYFPPENPQKFTNVHKVFGASNVAKILQELNANQREDAVNSLAYEAEYRLRDPVYGCVGLVSILQHKLKQVLVDLENAKKELATYIGPSALLPMINHPGLMQQHPNYGAYQMMPYNMQQQQQQMMGVPHGGVVIQEPQHQMIEAQQLAAAAREQEMLRHYEHQQQQQQQQQHQQQQPNDQMIGLINGGFDDQAGGGAVTATGFNQMQAGAMQPSLALGGAYELMQQQPGYHSNSHHQAQAQQFQIQAQELLMQQQEQQNAVVAQHPQQLVQQRDNSDEGRSNIGPSS